MTPNAFSTSSSESSATGGSTRDDLQTGLAVVLKRVDTGSSWILGNNPRSKYWATPPDRAFIGNAHLPLANVVRASAAAPSYFDPEPIAIAEGQAPGLFLDGAITPHNNPSLFLFLSATLPPYGLEWPVGVDKLTIVSVGTGSFRPTTSIEEAKRGAGDRPGRPCVDRSDRRQPEPRPVPDVVDGPDLGQLEDRLGDRRRWQYRAAVSAAFRAIIVSMSVSSAIGSPPISIFKSSRRGSNTCG